MPSNLPIQRRNNKKGSKFYIIILILIGFSFWVGINVGYVNSREAESLAFLVDADSLPPEGIDFSHFWKAWNKLEEKFVSATTTNGYLSTEDRIWGAIEGLANSYDDPYTVFLPPVEATIFEEDIKGSFGGVGIEVGIRNSVLTVIAPLKGTPADSAGILSGDRIVEIDGESTHNVSIDEAVQKIRGEIGQPVELTISREGGDKLKTFTIVRGVINIPTIDTELRDDDIFIISLYNFSASSVKLFREALDEFVKTGSDKLILDLRNNPGGFLEAAVDMASWFLPAGKVVVTENFGDVDEPRVHRSKGHNIFTDDLKMVILVNSGSASASEILAGALREHKVATLIGENTFGKGSVQEIVKITPETSLKVTIARWLTPNGTSISEGGLTPDMVIEPEEGSDTEEDIALKKAVEFLLGN